MKKVYEIDGDKFENYDEFCLHISQTLIPGHSWKGNLDAFNDILRGGFGTPDDGFIIKWKNSSRSRDKLGYAATVKYLEGKVTTCHPTNRKIVEKDLQLARKNNGQTLFDILVEIIREHGSEGKEADSGVELILD